MDRLKIKEETFADRWDRTLEFTASKGKREETRWKRRLDSIARLIENASTCAAIAINGSSFLIATNKEFSRGEDTKDKGYVLINTVMNFFKKVAKGTDTVEDFKNVFEEICQNAMSGLQISVYKKELFAEAGFFDKLRRAGKDETKAATSFRDFLSEVKEGGGHYPKDEGAAFAVCLALFKDLEKVIKFIKSNRGSDAPQLADFIKAVNGYNESNIITKDRLIGKICSDCPEGHIKAHAEMKIIACLEEQLKSQERYENYIGISKLCCMDCHAIIHAINAAGSYNNHIEIRGAHNVRYPGEWSAPFSITGNPPKLSPPVGRRHDKPEPFIAAIIDDYRRTYKENPEPVTGLPQHHDDSQSSSEDEMDVKIAIGEFVNSLRTIKEQFLQLTGDKVSKRIVIEPKIFQIIDLLLKEVNTSYRLQNWLKTWVKEDIVLYLESIEAAKQLDADGLQTMKWILGNKLFVGQLAASKFSMLLQALEVAQGKQKNADDRSEELEAQLVIYATELAELSQRDPGGLGTKIFKICTGVNIESEKQLVAALNLLLQQGGVEPLLQSLDLQPRHALIQTLDSPPFAEEGKYGRLRAAAKEMQTTALIGFLLAASQEKNGEPLYAFINDLREGKRFSPSIKEEFLDTLRSMEPKEHARLNKILEVISKNPELSFWLSAEITRKFSSPDHNEFRRNIDHMLMLMRQQQGALVLQQMQPRETLQDRVERRPAQEDGDGIGPAKTKHHKGPDSGGNK